MQVFTTAGNHTYNPTSGTTSIMVHCVGGGGGSGSAQSYGFSGGGGAGGVGIRHYNSAEFGTSAAITVGSGGSAGASVDILVVMVVMVVIPHLILSLIHI